MMKFRFRRQGADPQREKLKQELFAFHKTVEHGFPNQPSALAFDPELRIMAIGTRSGAVKIYGAPGVEFTGLHRDAATVTQMHFLPGQGRVLTLLDDDSLHLWEIVHHDGCAHLEEALHFQAPSWPGFDGASGLPSLAHITVVLLVAVGDMAALGTEGGSIFFLDVPTLTLLEGQTLGPDEVLRSVPDDYRCGKALGPVESLQGHLRDPTKILIGYSRGLLVIWNQAARCAERIFLGNQQLESVCWERSGHTVVSSHSDGSYAIWAADTGDSPAVQPTVATTPYGPFPCKAINKVLWRSCASGSEHFVIFSGGMPRASYGDRHCVSVLQAETLVTLDFTSRVIDFFTVHSTRPEDEFDEPQALAVLLEEELVVLDLQTPGWPAVPAPYLAPLHSSAITCSAHVANVPAKLWARIVSAGEQQSPQPASGASSWPITGGRNLAQEPSQRGLLLTGHEDGTVRFWDASGVALRPLYKLSTAGLFQTDCEHADSLAQAAEDDWPPFRKVGCFDPYSDDPRLGVQKVALCKYTAQMVVAGTAGQVLVLELSDTPAEQAVGVASLDLLQDREGFTWKGHERLSPRLGPLPWPAGFQPRALIQCLPPAAVTAVTLHAEWGLVAFGTSHGFGLFDYLRRSPVLARCTLHPSDSLAMEGPLSRVKSLKKSLRQSFRRIRKSRASGKKRMVAGSKLQEANAQLAEQAGPQDVEVTPVQRRIEPRSADDSLSGVVRCLYFADTFLRDAAHHGPTMWAGTNSGSVFAYALEVPAAVAGGEKRPERAVEAVLGKEVQLMHRAPVVAIAVLDGRGRPLPEPYEASRDLAQAPDMQGGHAVLIASEEQFKVFTLPKVSAKTKFKLTAHEGCRVRKVALATFASVACEDYTETCLACLTNLGDVHVFSVPGLRPQVHYACIRKEDISGIASCVFTRHGQGFYLISPSEFERFSLSARNITEPLCSLDVRWPRDATCVSHRSRESPKLSQANGTPGIILAPQSRDGSPDPICKEADTLEPPEAMLSPMSIDSATSADTTLDTTGDMTVEDVKDFLGSSEESEKNLRNLSEEEARACAILIK
uniref:LLGL scribble cell polarity complex component 1 n=1 Tax=Ovis aries TaxID=9940 RepID=A0AC11CR84_SHEEP